MIGSPSEQAQTSFGEFVHQASCLIDAANAKQAFTICYIDITSFKKFNDHYGFSVGDQLLTDLNAELNAMRRTVLCSRVFSDHFLRLAQFDSREDTMAFLVENMEATLRDFEARQAVRFPDCALSFSCGYCKIVGGSAGLVQAIDDANLARKEAKSLGRTRAVWFDMSMRQKLAQQERLEVELRSGLRNEQFTFFLQPKVDLHTGAIVGAEALARWDRPDGKAVPPDQFIPLMETSDLVLSLDRLVFRQVCDYLHARLEQGSPVVPISVNMSRRHIQDRGFPEILHHMARERSIPPHLLEIELTETVLLTDLEQAKAAIRKLRAYGYQVSIDDFGSGYTGMDLWRDLDFDTVKLDRSYIRPDAQRAEALRNDIVITSLAYISRQLNTCLLCEGPETAEQCAHMEALGCDVAQGYYFSPPVCQQRFDQLMEAGPYHLPYRQSWDDLPSYSHQEMATLRGGRQVLDLAGCALIILRPDDACPDRWKWVDLNQIAAELYGFPDPETALRQSFDPIHDFTDPADLPKLTALLSAPPNGAPSPVAFQITSLSRRIHYLAGTVRWASSEGGGAFCLMTLIDDTQRYETIRSKLELATVVEALPTSLFHLTFGPDGHRSIQFFSHRLQKRLGYTAREYELLEKTHMEWSLILEEDREPLRRQLATLLPSRRPFSLFFHVVSKKGLIYQLALSAAFSRTEGDSLVYTGILTDMTVPQERDTLSRQSRPDLWSYNFVLDVLSFPATEDTSGLDLGGRTQFSLEEFLSMDVLPAEDQAIYRELFQQIGDGAPFAQAKLRARQIGGGYAFFQLTCHPTAWDKLGRPVELSGVAVPI